MSFNTNKMPKFLVFLILLLAQSSFAQLKLPNPSFENGGVGIYSEWWHCAPHWRQCPSNSAASDNLRTVDISAYSFSQHGLSFASFVAYYNDLNNESVGSEISCSKFLKDTKYLVSFYYNSVFNEGIDNSWAAPEFNLYVENSICSMENNVFRTYLKSLFCYYARCMV